MSTKPDPVFRIHIGQTPRDSTVVCNGHDISAAIRAVEFTLVAGSLPTLKLTAAHLQATVDIEAAIKDVVVECPMAETTTIADTAETFAPVVAAPRPAELER